MKKSYKVFAIFCIITLIILMSTVIYAYYTNKKSIENNIVFGYNEIEVIEDGEALTNIEKGKSFRKNISIKNIGTVDCYIRIKSIISDSRIIDSIKIDYNLKDFTYNSNDGYYYYNEILSPSEATNSFFTTISINNDANDIAFKDFDIYTYVEAVQTVENKSMTNVWNYFNK